MNRSYICLLGILLLMAGCNRDQSQTVDTSILSAPTSPQPEDQPQSASSAAPPASMAPTEAAPAPITYHLPPGWSQQPGTDMRFATFTGPEHMQIAVDVFPGDVGGTLANVNRWRKQMDLRPITQDQLNRSITTISTAAGSALLVDLSNHDQRMLAAMLSTENQTWFFKMTASIKQVAKYAGDFSAIIKSVEPGQSGA